MWIAGLDSGDADGTSGKKIIRCKERKSVPGNGNRGSLMRNEHWYDSGQRHPDSGFSDHASFELYEGPWFVRVILQETDDERMDAVRRDWKVGNFDWGKWNPHEKRAGIYRVQLGGL